MKLLLVSKLSLLSLQALNALAQGEVSSGTRRRNRAIAYSETA